MTIDGDLRTVRVLARRMASRADAMMLNEAARNIARSVEFLRAEASGRLPELAPAEPYDGLALMEALAQLAVRAQQFAGDDDKLAAELTACRDALNASLRPPDASRGSLGDPDADGAGAARSDASRTSRAAAETVAPRTGTQRARILTELWNVARYNPQQPGLTDVELARITGLSPNSVRPRRVELVRGGWVEDTGRTKPHHGGEHTVWAVTERAAAELSGGVGRA